MATFKNLKDLQNWLEPQLADMLLDSMEVESVLQDAMAKAIVEKVYNVYHPEVYERRGFNGGLSDPRNMKITGISVQNGMIKLTFENLTMGADNLENEYIGDLIEYGEGFNGKHWQNSQGEWAKPRPFSAEAARSLNENPTYLIQAVIKGLKERGFKVSL